MRLIIVGIIILALGVAGVSTYLIQSFRVPEAQQEMHRKLIAPKKYVLVAARNLDIGERIQAPDMTWQPWSDESLIGDYVVRDEYEDIDPAEKSDFFINARVRYPMVAGEPLLAKKVFQREAPGFMAGKLSPGMRAVTLRVREDTASGGYIFPGDFVDVLLTHTLATQVRDPAAQRDGAQELQVLSTLTETILTRKRVISIGQQSGTNIEGNAMVVPSITLEVTRKESEMLTVATRMGELSLVLRSMDEDRDPNAPAGERTFTTDVEVSPFLNAERENRRVAAEAEAAAAAEAAIAPPVEEEPKGPVIRIYRAQSGSVEEVQR